MAPGPEGDVVSLEVRGLRPAGDERDVRIRRLCNRDGRGREVDPGRPTDVAQSLGEPPRAAPEVENRGVVETERLQDREDGLPPPRLEVIRLALTIPPRVPIVPLLGERRQRLGRRTLKPRGHPAHSFRSQTHSNGGVGAR